MTLQQKLLNLVVIVFDCYDSGKDELNLWAWYTFQNHTVNKIDLYSIKDTGMHVKSYLVISCSENVSSGSDDS